jgi:hypothetical protein
VGNKFNNQGGKNKNNNNKATGDRKPKNKTMGEMFLFFRNNYNILLDTYMALKANDRKLDENSRKKFKEFDDNCMTIAQDLNSDAARRILTETYSVLSGENQNIKLIQLSQKLYYIANRESNIGNKSKALAKELSDLCHFLSDKRPEAAELPKMIMEGVVCYVEG